MKHAGELRDILGYQLRRASLIADDDARHVLEPFGLTPAKLTALLLIRGNPGCDQSALGRALSINRSSAMKLVNVLVDRGLIERRSGRDLRTNALYLTPEGEGGLIEMLDRLREADRELSDGLTAAERTVLLKLLQKVRPPRIRAAAGRP